MPDPSRRRLLRGLSAGLGLSALGAGLSLGAGLRAHREAAATFSATIPAARW